ncbi:MAG TPA: MotA/TolQ/ExbB proton channel family protein [Chitinispirillaceae bacterium]|nr:MotA/TolQ/ExbB proton channel family protein [Chitinispirillaceae bacterium]
MVESLARWYYDGGPFMAVILAVLALAIAVTIERLIFYYFICNKKGSLVVSQLASSLNEQKTDQARKILSKGKDPQTVLLRTALERYEAKMDIDEIQEGIEETAIQQVPRLSQRLNYLTLFANIATLLGLLGTITGLQLSFSSLANIEAAKKASMLASGISQAMLTTAFGLIVAIPCMVVYTFLYNKQNQLVKDLDEATVKFLNYLKKKKA